MKAPFTNPQAIAEAGERIYKDKYQALYEPSHTGSFVAIDVLSDEAYLADTPEGALKQARQQAPHGLFHLIRIGAPGAFRVSYSAHATKEDFHGA